MTKFELTKHFEIVAEINQSFLDSNFMIDQSRWQWALFLAHFQQAFLWDNMRTHGSKV